MRERPILYSAPMVRRLPGIEKDPARWKTQTRRLIKPQPPTREAFFGSDFGLSRAVADGVKMYSQNDWALLPKHPTDWDLIGSVGVARDAGFPMRYRCPFGEPGDRLWVKETFCIESSFNVGDPDYHPSFKDGRPVRHFEDEHFGAYWEQPHYRATDPRPELVTNDFEEPGVKWKPSIFMPRWASRVALEVADVRAEQLQEISEEDAKAEGLSCLSKDGGRTWKHGIPDRDGLPGSDDDGWEWTRWEVDPRRAYRTLWESIHGPDSWNANPWVWVLKLERVTP